MARSTVQLFDTQLKKAKPKDKDYLLGDGQGLSLRVRSSGAKSWLFDYYHPITKKRKKMGFGSYPEISLKKARQLRSYNRQLIAKGTDPIEHKENELSKAKSKAENTFQVVAEQWFAVKTADTKKISPNHGKKIKSRLVNYLYPELANVAIDKLTPKKCIDALTPFSKRGIDDTVKRCCSLINEVMTYATNIGLIDFNPLTGITKAFPSTTNTPQKTIPPEELPRLVRAINQSNLTLQSRILLELQLHTMVRSSKIIQATGDFTQALWIIPAEAKKETTRAYCAAVYSGS